VANYHAHEHRVHGEGAVGNSAKIGTTEGQVTREQAVRRTLAEGISLYANGGAVALAATGAVTPPPDVAVQGRAVEGDVAFGSGQYLTGSTGTATLTGCAVQANNALGGFGSGGSGGQASGQGGGLYISADGVAVSLDSATVARVTGNTASSGAAFDNIVGPYTLI
jgi:hypothetical protein